MFSVSRLAAGLALLGVTATAAELRVCSDPDNLPFSNRGGQGFENQIAELVGKSLGVQVRYVWFPLRAHYLRKTLQRGLCDLLIGINHSAGGVTTTIPYYRSTYVFITPDARRVHSFEDPKLRTQRIGVQVLQAEQAVTPPAQALIDRGLGAHIVWYKIVPDFLHPNPAALVEAVDRGEIDSAVAWGPAVSYFARRTGGRLALTPVETRGKERSSFVFDIAMATRKSDAELAARLDTAIRQQGPAIHRILRQYGVPVVDQDDDGEQRGRKEQAR